MSTMTPTPAYNAPALYDAADAAGEVVRGLLADMESAAASGVIANAYLASPETLVVVTNGGQTWVAEFEKC